MSETRNLGNRRKKRTISYGISYRLDNKINENLIVDKMKKKVESYGISEIRLVVRGRMSNR